MRTELVFILDRSGSMSGLEKDTIGGYNALLEKQQKEEGACRVTTVLFDNNYELLHDRLELQAINPITERDYFVRGSTALLDAIGHSINKIVNAQRTSKPEYRADKVMFVITTDGLENASRDYDYKRIKDMIERQKKQYHWEFIFIGADIDVIKVSEQFGIDRSRAKRYYHDDRGVAMKYNVMSEAVSQYRQAPAGENLSDSWGDDLDEEVRRRGD
jgi:uncharacterized protein YegL